MVHSLDSEAEGDQKLDPINKFKVLLYVLFQVTFTLSSGIMHDSPSITSE